MSASRICTHRRYPNDWQNARTRNKPWPEEWPGRPTFSRVVVRATFSVRTSTLKSSAGRDLSWVSLTGHETRVWSPRPRAQTGNL